MSSRYVIAAVAGGLYVAIAAWVIQGQGRAYRDALRRESLARNRPNAQTIPVPAIASAATPVPATATEPPVPATAPPVPSRREEAAPKPSREDGTGPPSTAVTVANPGSGQKPLEVSRPAAPPVLGEQPAPTPPGPPDPAVVWADALDLARLKPEDERRLGGELHRVIMGYNPPFESPTLEQRIEEVARPLLQRRSRKEIEYTFTLLDSEVVNAFSHPGGHVYVSRKLFQLIGEDEDYALEFVLGHEIAHVDLNHALKCVAPVNAEEKSRGLGTLAQFYLLIAFGYPDPMEYEADAWALRRMMIDLDRSRHDALAFLRKFEGYARANKFASGRRLPPQKAEGSKEIVPSLVENHYRAHTAAWKRLTELNELSEKLKTPPR